MVNEKVGGAMVILKSLALVVGGTLILSFGVSVFLVPFDLVCGGITGIAIAAAAILPEGAVTVEMLITLLSWAFFFVGLFTLGTSFALKTLVSTIVYPIGVYCFSYLVRPDFLGGYFSLAESTHPEVALVLASLIGGALMGVGVALAFLAGSSTGGVDVIAYLVCKRFSHLSPSRVAFAVDAAIVLLGAVAINDLVITLLGVISALVGALLLDRVFLGGSKALVAYINSPMYDEIRAAIIDEMQRSTMILEVTGGYSGKRQRVIMVSFTVRQYARLSAIIERFDRTAFVTVYRAHEIGGRGWTYDKPSDTLPR